MPYKDMFGLQVVFKYLGNLERVIFNARIWHHWCDRYTGLNPYHLKNY